MFLKIGKKKVFASIFAGFMAVLCLIAPHLTILQSKGIVSATTNSMNAMEGQSNIEMTTKADSGVAGTKVTVNGIDWLVPVTFTSVTSEFGMRDHPIDGEYKMHYGIDLAADSITNKPVIAARGGTAYVSYGTAGGGFMVTINHADNYSTTYMHMTHYAIKNGVSVKAGQVIGYVGSTGGSTGSHLHYQVSHNGAPTNPRPYLGLELT